ncbi:MAG: hypothetical protein IT423_14800 [Pirellulaceae bacterium]|nr:hypothetical protein [Pirellulaceae bacterium]
MPRLCAAYRFHRTSRGAIRLQPGVVWGLICLGLWHIGLTSATAADELRYRWQPKQKFSYNMTVTIDENDKITSFKGMIHYEVTAANAEQMKVTYTGGLRETVQRKQSNSGSGGPFGPRGFGGPGGPFGPRGFGGPPSPFSRPAFAGKVQTTNRITMTPTGHVLAMDGDSHLPYLLGNVSLMPFESLPKGNDRQWVVDSGVSITEENEDQRRPFGAFGPFAGQDDKSVQAASEITRYEWQGQQNNLVTIKKSYQLTSPGADGESFDMNGAGIWTFDMQDHVPHALDMTAKLITKEGNSSTTFPITLKYVRLTAAELDKIEADARRLVEEQQRKVADAKLKSETPLTPEEKRESLAGLKSQAVADLKKTLTDLESKSLSDPDPEIATAIRALLKHADEDVAAAASKALAKWSPEYKRTYDLNKAYGGPSPVSSSDLEVNSTTPLYVGQIVQVQEHGSFWYAARIKTLLPDGKVRAETLAWGKPNREVTVTRRNVQLAPPEVEQPAPPAGVTNGAGLADVQVSGQSRTWSDKTGRFKVDAMFVGQENGVVKLQRPDGKQVNVPLEKLSPQDQAFIRQLLEENPFEVK